MLELFLEAGGFNKVEKEFYLVFKSSIITVKAGKKPFLFCYRVSLVMVLNASEKQFII